MTLLEREELITRFKAMTKEEQKLVAELIDPQIMIDQIKKTLNRYASIEKDILEAYHAVSNYLTQ